MRDYEELVTALREHASAYVQMFGVGDSSRMMDEAADAIEELCKKREAACWGCQCKKLDAPKWISVEDALPSPRERVLVAYRRGVTIAEYRGYDVTRNVKKMCWCGQNGPKHTLSSVTHWMPLPEPPVKEET